MGTAFTYQGRLLDANSVADGLYDLQFKLFDDPNIFISNQIGSDINVPDLDVIDGYFTAELDFSNVFDGNAYWLEIGVRPGDQNDPCAYTILEPRQEVTPTPYALHAKTAAYAENTARKISSTTFVIAASNSKHKNRADYTCDGTDDHVEIQAAIDALKAADGGQIILLDGVYNCDPMTITSSNITLNGLGSSTIIKLAPQNLDVLGEHSLLLIYGTEGNHLKNIVTRNIQFDGNKAAHSGTKTVNMEVINFKFIDGGMIENCLIKDAISEGIDIDYSTNIIVTKNGPITDCGGFGIHISEESTDCIVIANVVSCCGADFARGGIDQHSSSSQTIYIGNWAENCYRNYSMQGSAALFLGNHSRNGTNRDILDAVANYGFGTPNPHSPLSVYKAASNTPGETAFDITCELSAGGVAFGFRFSEDQDLILDRRYANQWFGNICFDRNTGNMLIGDGSVPAASALLELKSTNGALLLPRMTTMQRDALTAVNGMVIYNTTTKKVEFQEDGAWVTKKSK